MKQAGITDMLFSWPYDSICLKCMIKLLYNLEMTMMISIVFYKITKIALALWFAERHDCTKVCKQSCALKILCCEGQVYLIYPFPWLLRLGNIYKHVGLKFFSVSCHSKQVKPIWFEIVFQQKKDLITVYHT